MAKSYAYGSKLHKQYMINTARYRSKQSGVPFDLTTDDINIPETCPVLGINMVASEKGGGDPNSATLDRLLPELGYVKDNVAVISMKANRMKSNCTPEDLVRIALWSQRKLALAEASNVAL